MFPNNLELTKNNCEDQKLEFFTKILYLEARSAEWKFLNKNKHIFTFYREALK